MCAVCVCCGKCEGIQKPKLDPGVCPFCWHKNDATCRTCENCGKPLPALPGVSKAVGE